MTSDHTPAPTTIEATGKRWKLLQLVGVVLLVISVPTCVAGANADSDPAIGVGMVLGMAGFALYVLGRTGAWWFHG